MVRTRILIRFLPHPCSFFSMLLLLSIPPMIIPLMLPPLSIPTSATGTALYLLLKFKNRLAVNKMIKLLPTNAKKIPRSLHLLSKDMPSRSKN